MRFALDGSFGPLMARSVGKAVSGPIPAVLLLRRLSLKEK